MIPTALTLRLARRLEAAWAARDGPSPDPESAWRALETRLELARRARRRLRLAVEAGLSLIVPRLTAELSARLDEVRRSVEQLRLEYTPPPGRAPDLGQWVGEVHQVEAEFGGLEVRWRDAVVRVVTDPVTLRGVELGPFAVEFGWDRVGHTSAPRCFDVVALEPHPAAGRDEVVHPHVQGVELCAGDAAGPLGRALSDGRLADAVLIVRSVLTTYNPQSAYVPLTEWDGVPCADCGRRVDPEDRSSCEGCDADLCESCAGSCTTCPAPRCGACLGSCDVCRASCCRGCLTATRSGRDVCPECRIPCARCSADVPRDELTAGSRRCPACDAGEEDEIDDDRSGDATPLEVPKDAG